LREVKFFRDGENTTKKKEETEACERGSTFRGDMMLEK